MTIIAAVEAPDLEAERPEPTQWVRPDFDEFATPPEVTAYAGER